MTWLISSSLRLRLVVVVLSAVLIVFGIRTLERAQLDVFPEFAPPQVEIQTEAPGLSTEEVESMISMPIENALHGVPWVKTIRSKSVLGSRRSNCFSKKEPISFGHGNWCRSAWPPRPAACPPWL